MKDLYTFDIDVDGALDTYKVVQAAYLALFRDLRLPVIMAEASSGDMGGDRSHEFHLPCEVGEDFVVNCSECEYAANAEVAQAAPPRPISTHNEISSAEHPAAWLGITKDRKTVAVVWYSRLAEPGQLQSQSIVNTHAVKTLVPNLDTSVDDALAMWNDTRKTDQQVRVITLVDRSLSTYGPLDSFQARSRKYIEGIVASNLAGIESAVLGRDTESPTLQLLRVQDGDSCSRCSNGRLQVRKALELGHAFYLGTRYSQPLDARVLLPPWRDSGPAGNTGKPESGSLTALQMGCFGIGVSRVIGAIAQHFSDDRGLLWPLSVAPFEAIIIPGPGLEEDATQIYDSIRSIVDAVLDDRPVNLAWKLKDADLVGYPVVILVANTWKRSQLCEIRCRLQGQIHMAPLGQVKNIITSILAEL